MSIRFFDAIQFDVHNLGMATDRHQAPSYPLRMPEELKAKIQAAADAAGRSLHAELLHRLQSSFDGGGVNPAIVADQAEQIWQLRQQIASAYVAMGRALGTLLDEPGFDHDQAVGGLKVTMEEVSNDAGKVLNQLLSKDWGPEDRTRDLLSAFSNHVFSEPLE